MLEGSCIVYLTQGGGYCILRRVVIVLYTVWFLLQYSGLCQYDTHLWFGNVFDINKVEDYNYNNNMKQEKETKVEEVSNEAQEVNYARLFL